MGRALAVLAFPALALLVAGCGDGRGDDRSGAPPRSFHPDGAVRALEEFIAEREADPEARRRIDRAQSNWKFKLPRPPQVEFTAGKTYYWDLTTNRGTLRLKLRPDAAPMHVANVIYLTLLGFYDGTPFHRSIQRFMIQGGCPAGNGRGDPGYRLDLEVSTALSHDRPGMVASANSGPNTDGSQFYILFAPSTPLDGSYTLFGELADGMVTLRALESVSAPAGSDGPPREPLVLERAAIVVE